MAAPSATPDAPPPPSPTCVIADDSNFKGLQDKLKLIFGGAIGLSVLVIFIVWFMIMNGGVQISRARKLGEGKQRECGSEHMEAETARHEIAMIFNGEVKKTLYASVALLLSVGVFFLVPVIAFGFAGWKAVPPTASKWQKWSTLAISVGMVSHLASFIGVWGGIANYKSYAEPTNFDSAKLTAKKTTDALISFTVLGIAGATALFVLLRNCMIAALPLPPRVALTVLFAIAMLVVILFNRDYTILSGYINEYRDKVDKVNASLKTLLNPTSTTDPIAKTVADGLMNNTKSMLKQNIRRLDTESSNDPDINSSRYADQLYAYTFHKDGEEGDFISNRSGMLKHIVTLNDKITTLYNANKTNDSFLTKHTKVVSALEHLRTLVTVVTATPQVFEITDAISELEIALADLCTVTVTGTSTHVCSAETDYADTIQSLRDSLILNDELPSTSVTNLASAVRDFNTSKLPEESSTFVDRVFWGSVVVLGFLSFIPFHILYRKYRDILTIVSVAIIAFFLFILSVYGWFMGQTTAV